ncbi:hypothetical protein E4U30_003250, partial [Claviceps sp. LM220 group G6]
MYEARSCDITVRDSGGTTFEEGSRTKMGFSKKLEMIGLLRTKLFNLSPGHRLSNDPEFDPGGLSELRHRERPPVWGFAFYLVYHFGPT